jgi:DNA repair protein RadD
MITITGKATNSNGDAPAKKCPECSALIHAAYQVCPECGYVFPAPQKSNITEHAFRNGIISGEIFFDDYDVSRTYYCVHEKRYSDSDTPKTMRIDYQVGIAFYQSEWVCPEHTGYARDKFVKWWKERAAFGSPIPTTAKQAVDMANNGALAPTLKITVRSTAGEKFDRITRHVLGERPVAQEYGEIAPEMYDDPPSNSPQDLGICDDDIPF